MHVPSVDDCLECNKVHGNQFSYKRQCFSGPSQQSIYRDEPQRRRTSVYDQLGRRISPHDQLVEEANARVSDEPYARDPEAQGDCHHDSDINPK